MLGKSLDHIAIVVKNINKQVKWFCKIYDAKKLGKSFIYKKQKVKIQFLKSANLQIELLQAYGKNSPIKNFLNKNENSKYNHIAFNVKNLDYAEKFVKKNNGKVVMRAKNGWRGNEIMFALFFNKNDYQLIEYVKTKKKKFI